MQLKILHDQQKFNNFEYTISIKLALKYFLYKKLCFIKFVTLVVTQRVINKKKTPKNK